MSSGILTELRPAEYSLRLSTGETLEVAEFDTEHHPAMADPSARRACASVLARVPSLTPEAMDAAKMGDDGELLSLLRAQPAGALQMVDEHGCALSGECAMHTARCSTRRVKRGRADFPECWEFSPSDPKLRTPDSRGMATAVVHAWREGRVALLVVR